MSVSGSEPGAPLPVLNPGDGSVLLHIGVPKTGTTALQAALAASRPELESLGVLYPGAKQSHHAAVRAALREPWGWGAQPEQVDPAPWHELVSEVANSSDRVVISSEFLTVASGEKAESVIHGMGDRRTVVVITLRPLAALTPSSYQQFLKYGHRLTYEEWLHTVLPYEGDPQEQPYWMRGDYAALVDRWTRLVGPENLVVIVLDPADRESLFRDVARLLSIPASTLLANRQVIANRSMTAAESALLLKLNLAFRGPRDWAWYERYVRRGLVRALVEQRDPAPDEPMLVTPAWAQEELLRVALDSIVRIRESGVCVLGDLNSLATPVDRDVVALDHASPTLPLEACEIAVRGMAERIPAVRGRSGSTKKPTFRTRASHRLRRAKK
ncbi:MAG: hypothetical protein U0904_08590, partial [Candidatus Nanopelagicales bacterium]|nr:hypothetical protein [Candidatus Nanopelagicales bacterium]